MHGYEYRGIPVNTSRYRISVAFCLLRFECLVYWVYFFVFVCVFFVHCLFFVSISRAISCQDSF